MKNLHPLRSLRMTLFAILVLSFASKAFASFDAYLDFKDEKSGKVTKVHLAADGSFESPALPAGTYLCSWSFGSSNPTSVGSSGMSAGRPSSPSSNASSVSSPETATLTYRILTAREAGSGMATGRRQYQPVTIRKRIDKASPQLFTFEKITIDNGDKINGKLVLQDASGKACAIATYDVKAAKK